MRHLLLLLTSAAAVFGQNVKVWEDRTTIPTYRERVPDDIPLFDQLALNGSGNSLVYPYTSRDNLTGDRQNVEWRLLHVENEYLHCRVLPDLGGKLYGCLDKLSGAELFYTNSSVKKIIAAPRGAWTAGGVEASFPIAHPRLAVAPVRWALTTDASGAATISVGALDRVSGMEWQVSYTLRPGSAVLEQNVLLYNRGEARRPFQYWTNAAIRLPDSGLRLTYPMWVTAPHGAGILNSWPVNAAGVDMTKTANYTQTAGLFAYGSREPFFGAYNPESRIGVSHWADPKQVPGKKLWVWEHKQTKYKQDLSDDQSGYTEIQAGLLETQEMMEFLEPQHERRFTELWIPSRKTGGITRATPDAVLFLERRPQPNGKIALAFDINVTHNVAKATVKILNGTETVFDVSRPLSPADLLHEQTPELSPATKYRVELRDGAGKLLLAHQEDTYDATPASEVKLLAPRPKGPEKKGAEAALATAEADEEVRVMERAEAEYAAALRSYPKNPAVRKATARFWFGIGRFEDADGIFAALEKEGAGDPEIAYYHGVARLRLGDEKGALELWRNVPEASPFHAAAQFETAGALARSGKRQEAAAMFRQAGTPRATSMTVALLRTAGQAGEAKTLLDRLLAERPTDDFLRFEATLLGRTDEGFWRRMASDPEWTLDVVDDYFFLGLYEEPVTLLSHTYPTTAELERELGSPLPQDDPLCSYYRAYARSKLGQPAEADFQKASTQSTQYVNPWRPSTAAVLRAALDVNPQDATAHYLLGALLLTWRQTDAALSEWNEAKPAGSRIPAFYHTVALVMENVKRDRKAAEAFIEEAIAHNPADESLPKLLTKLRGTKPAAAPASGATPLPEFTTPLEAADYVFSALAAGRANEAGGVFKPVNFPGAKQPTSVRQAYLETELQLMVSVAKNGNCHNVELAIDSVGSGNNDLPFTFTSFSALTKQPRMQFYFGLIEAACGERKAAVKRWAKVAKTTAPLLSADYAFPIAATALLDPGGSIRTVEQALEKVRTASATEEEKGYLLYAEAVLLRAIGREEEAGKRLAAGVNTGPAFTRYLNGAAQFDPPWPKALSAH